MLWKTFKIATYSPENIVVLYKGGMPMVPNILSHDCVFYLYTNNLTKPAQSELAYASLLEIAQTFHPVAADAIERNELGKPIIKGHPFHFSISHSKDLIFIAISRNPIGIDCEFHKPRGFEKLVTRMFSESETLHYASTPTMNTFYTIWCTKEALLKYTGVGIRYKDVKLLDTRKLLPKIEYNGEAYTLPPLVSELPLDPEYTGILAHHNPLKLYDLGVYLKHSISSV